jgi:hypothetical protein
MTPEEWLDRYEARLIVRGLDKEFAHATRQAAEVDLDYPPEGAADDEISYMADDYGPELGGDS